MMHFLLQYELLRLVENIRLAPALLEPEPVEINLKGKENKGNRQGDANRDLDGESLFFHSSWK